MFVLQLNPMTGRAEEVVAVAHAETEQELKDFVEAQRTDTYEDSRFRKTFKQGGPLEWMNPPNPDWTTFNETKAIVNVGTREDWANTAMQNFDRLVATTFKV